MRLFKIIAITIFDSIIVTSLQFSIAVGTLQYYVLSVVHIQNAAEYCAVNTKTCDVNGDKHGDMVCAAP